MARVARPGARVVVSDVDYDTLLVDAPDVALTRRILGHHADVMPSGRVGRRLPALFREVGLTAIEVFPYTAIVREWDDEVLKLREKAERARDDGLVTDAEVASWLASLAAAARAGMFLGAVTVFTVRGRKT
jgi:hypothetical protein